MNNHHLEFKVILRSVAFFSLFVGSVLFTGCIHANTVNGFPSAKAEPIQLAFYSHKPVINARHHRMHRKHNRHHPVNRHNRHHRHYHHIHR